MASGAGIPPILAPLLQRSLSARYSLIALVMVFSYCSFLSNFWEEEEKISDKK